MTILHCLGSGLVGAYVVRHLVEAGHEVHVYDIKPNSTKGIIEAEYPIYSLLA